MLGCINMDDDNNNVSDCKPYQRMYILCTACGTKTQIYWLEVFEGCCRCNRKILFEEM